jgi:hypothetical protein
MSKLEMKWMFEEKMIHGDERLYRASDVKANRMSKYEEDN